MVRWLAVAVALVVGCVASSSAKTRRDTYLTALKESQGSSSVAPGEVYGAPAADYGAPATLGYSYGAPVTVGYSYGPPAESHTLPENPFEPLHAKLILLFKVLLKLLVFKLIVKFIAIICVLFFLPKLSGLGVAKEAADEARTLKNKGEEEKLELTQFVLSAISSGPVACQPRDSALCRLNRAIHDFDQNNSFSRLFGKYMKEEEEKIRHNKVLRKSKKTSVP